jgi:hypothetical protein
MVAPTAVASNFRATASMADEAVATVVQIAEELGPHAS